MGAFERYAAMRLLHGQIFTKRGLRFVPRSGEAYLFRDGLVLIVTSLPLHLQKHLSSASQSCEGSEHVLDGLCPCIADLVVLAGSNGRSSQPKIASPPASQPSARPSLQSAGARTLADRDMGICSAGRKKGPARPCRSLRVVRSTRVWSPRLMRRRSASARASRSEIFPRAHRRPIHSGKNLQPILDDARSHLRT